MVEFVIGFVLFVLSIYYFLRYGRSKDYGTTNIDVEYSPGICNLPGCIRCDKNSTVNMIANEKFKKYFQSQAPLNRLKESFMNDPIDNKYIYYCNFLKSKPIWGFLDLPESYIKDLKLLKQNTSVFKKDFESLMVADKATRDLDGTTDWTKYFLSNQGVCNDSNLDVCMSTNIILKNCSNLMANCLFGNQFYSVLKPGCSIERHTGPTNVRLRCHVTLQLPNDSKRCVLNVGDETVSWAENEVLLFDDSLPHSVKYTIDDSTDMNIAGKDRVVLLLDFWHPDLSMDERICIEKCFSSSHF